MRYIVNKSQTKREELPPEDGAEEGGAEEGGWVELRRLSAGDVRIVDRMCQKAGIAVGSVNGVLLLLEQAVVSWSLPLPTERGKLRESLDKLSLDLVNFLGQAMTEDLPLTDEQRADLSVKRLGPIPQETAEA